MKSKLTEDKKNQIQLLESSDTLILEPFRGVSSLYIHIPFCARKCFYCDFFSVQYDESTARAYTDALCKELQLKSKYADKLITIYIGGGTPTLLTDACLMQIFSCLNIHYQKADYAEISFEANPGSITESKVNLLLSLGVNRISLGIQSLNDDELRTLGRIHTSEDALHCLEMMTNAGLKNVSVDLMYGIPGQSMASWRKTITRIIERMPAHISIYELTFEEGTPICALKQKPHDHLIVAMYQYAIDRLESHGYEQYEISNLAQPGFRCNHNMNYWSRGEYIGAGAGAHSFIGGLRSSTIRDIDRYTRQLNYCIQPETESTKISYEEKLQEFLFLGLRKREGVSIHEALNAGLDLVRAGREMLDSGHLEITDDYLRLSKTGIVISNAVIVRLLRELGL